jgi:hypothetical protein
MTDDEKRHAASHGARLRAQPFEQGAGCEHRYGWVRDLEQIQVAGHDHLSAGVQSQRDQIVVGGITTDRRVRAGRVGAQRGL